MTVLGRRFRTRVASGPALVLDGALGTELERLGIALELPLWSTRALLDAPHEVERIHRAYVEAGAEVLTAATFRTQRRILTRAGRPATDALRLTGVAVQLARAAGGALPVAGSAPPLEDCYRPDLVPEDAACEDEHAEHAANLAAAGVDVIAVETMNCAREAQFAARAAAATGLPFWVSFICDEHARLPSGEPLAAALDAVRDSGATLVGVNCSPPDSVAACLPVLAGSGLAFVAYANLGAPRPDGAFRTHDCSPGAFAAQARRWLEAGAAMIGGCCGTTPEHVRALVVLRG